MRRLPAPTRNGGASRRRRGAVVLAAVLLSGLAAAQAEGAVLAGRLPGASIPSAAGGVATVRAVNAQTGLVVAAAEVGSGGAWRLPVPAGPYTVLTAIIRRTGAVRGAITPIVRARGSKRAVVRVVLGRTRAPKVRRRTAAELRADATPGSPVVGFRYLTSPPGSAIGKSLSDLLLTDTVGARSGGCAPRVRELEHIELVNAEIEFSNSRYTDPATRIRRGQLLHIDLVVEGSVTEGADGSKHWDVRLRDTATGKVVGGDTTTVPAGGDWLEAEAQTAARLVDQMCGGTYDVNLALRTDGTFATHVAAGALNTTLTATRTTAGTGPATAFAGSAPAAYEGVTFTSTIGCAYVAPVITQGTVSVALSVTPAGRLHVAWTGSSALQTSASVLCPDAGAIPGQVGAWLVGPTPLEFDLPVDGGRQAIGGGFTSGGDGWVHSGAITIARRPPR